MRMSGSGRPRSRQARTRDNAIAADASRFIASSASPAAGPEPRRRPAEDVPAPVRFLPEYDNLLLAHRDRGRFNPSARPVPLPPGNGATTGTFLVDGLWEGTWQLRDRRLALRPYRKIDLDLLVAEADALRSFLAPDAEIVVDAP